MGFALVFKFSYLKETDVMLVKDKILILQRERTQLPLRPRLHYTVFIRRRYGNVPFWPTVYTVPFFYPASNEDYCIREYLSVYSMPFP